MEDERNTQSHQSGEADQVEVKDRGLFDSLLGRKKQEEDKKQEEVLVTGMEKVSVEEPEVTKEEHEAAGEKKESLLSKLHRSGSSSSSSSDEEEEVIDENGEIVKRKKKKGLKEKIKEKLPGDKDHVEGEHTAAAPAPPPAPFVTHGEHHDTPAPFVTHGEHHDTPAPFVPHGGHNDTPALSVAHGGHHDTDVVVEKIDGDVKTEAPVVPEEEKNGFLEKMKEKLPSGYKKPEDAAAVPATHAAPAPAHAPAPATEEVSSPDGKEKGILGKIMDKLPGYHKSAGEEEKAATATAGEHQTSG